MIEMKFVERLINLLAVMFYTTVGIVYVMTFSAYHFWEHVLVFIFFSYTAWLLLATPTHYRRVTNAIFSKLHLAFLVKGN